MRSRCVACVLVAVLRCAAVGQDPLAGDIDSSGRVDFLDFNILANNFLEPGEYKDGDIDGDGIVAFSDLVSLAETYAGFAGRPSRPSDESLGLITGPEGRLFIYSNEDIRPNGVSILSETSSLKTSDGISVFELYIRNETFDVTLGSASRDPPPIVRGALRLETGYSGTAIDDLLFLFGTKEGVFEGPIYPSIPGDADLDGRVEFSDFVRLADNFGKAGSWGQGDFTRNGLVEFPDFVALANNFGTRLPGVAAVAVPEPVASILCFTMAVISTVGLRRKQIAGRCSPNEPTVGKCRDDGIPRVCT